ncbi:hypothetical protein TNCV_1889641 [Trichonephila clavipes]|nr:hypothetical protein TNCV_1889641 [Trichonephila clavipes]
MVKVTDSWPAWHESEPSTAEHPLCTGAMLVKSAESSNVLPMLCQLEEGMPAQVSSSTLNHGSKLRGPSPKALK